jgi:hypothetical protein
VLKLVNCPHDAVFIAIAIVRVDHQGDVDRVGNVFGEQSRFNKARQSNVRIAKKAGGDAVPAHEHGLEPRALENQGTEHVVTPGELDSIGTVERLA